MTEPHRQPYGFGSFVKKITRPIKKIVKSPLGKAALIGGGLYGLGGLKSFGGTGMFKSGQGLKRFGNIAKMFGKKGKLGDLLYSGKGDDRKFSLGKAGLLGLLGVGTALPFMGGDEEEEVIETPWEETPSSISNILAMAKNRDPSLSFMPNNPYVQSGFYNVAGGGRVGLLGGGAAEAQAENMLRMEYQKYRNQGGTMSYQQFKMVVLKQAQQQGPMAQGQPQMAQPQMAAEGGLIDMGGMEKDYRAEGGFVPLGEKEKADDVPARLSKNEFVFTADAVRNAGGGDIDAGAEVMHNVMNHLEQGGQISEDSQGAQGMYNNMKQLETRVA